MRIFNEVGRWYSIPCKILTQVIYIKKKNLNALKRIRVIIRTPTHGPTDGRTDRQTDRRTDEQGESSIPPLNFVSGGINTALWHVDFWNSHKLFPFPVSLMCFLDICWKQHLFTTPTMTDLYSTEPFEHQHMTTLVCHQICLPVPCYHCCCMNPTHHCTSYSIKWHYKLYF